jgi:hypothetical protein
MKLLAANYQTRQDLENDVRNKIGLTPEAKDKHTIEGSRADLAKLSLSDRSIFWGIKCLITDDPTIIKKGTKPDRGQLHDFGINQRDKKAR